MESKFQMNNFIVNWNKTCLLVRTLFSVEPTAALLCGLSVLKTKGKSESEVAQLCPNFCNPMDCSLPGSSVHGIFQARVLKWVAISFSRGSSWPRDRNWVSRIAGRCFTTWATREAPTKWSSIKYNDWIIWKLVISSSNKWAILHNNWVH